MRNRNAMSTAAAVLAAGCLLASGACAQGVRGELSATASYVEYRTVVRESIPESQVPGTGVTRVLPDGTVVTCVPGGDCYYYRAGGINGASPVTQDLRLTAWPGYRGVSAQVHLRGRYGSDDFWPRSSQEFEALAAYVDFERRQVRVRAGRQPRASGLGFHRFDGAAVLWRGLGPLRVEGFAGRSLAGALNEYRSGDLLADADELAPDTGSMLWGAEGKLRLGRRFSSSLLYQREVRTDGDDLYTERVAFDARWSPPELTAEVSVDYDVAFDAFNEARLRLKRPLARTVYLSSELRHYEPFFELWTIWGAFSPVGYDEGRLSAFWEPRSGLSLSAGASYRDYEDTDVGVDFAPIEGDGWRAHLGASWVRREWLAAGTYSLYTGFGAYQSSVDASVGRHFGDRYYLGVYGSGTQQFAEYRFGDGTTFGGGFESRVQVQNTSLDLGLGVYRQTFDNRPGYDDYNQVRGRLGVTMEFGTEPVARSTGYGQGGAQS
jgi:hypothetical protein